MSDLPESTSGAGVEGASTGGGAAAGGGAGSAGGGAGSAGGGPEPARSGPVARFFNVFVSPGAVFEDIRRNPAGWWVPIVIMVLVTVVFTTIYVGKYDLALVLKEQLKDSWGMKLLSGLQGPEARDKALAIAVKQVASTPVWQMQISYWTNVLLGFVVMTWFFNFLYAVIALAMGWLTNVKTSKLWVNLGIFAGTAVGFLAISAGLQIARSVAVKAAGGSPEDMPPAPAWMAVASILIALAAAVVVLWSLSRLAREITFGRILGAVTYGLAPFALSSLIGIIVVLMRTPDATSFEELVPSNLTAIANLKESSAVLASLGSSLGIFSIWSVILTIIGLAKTLGKRTGEAAAVVLVPWIAYIMVRVLFSAIFG